MEALGRWDSNRMVRCLLMGSRGSPWVRWSWLVIGCCGWGGRGSPWVVLAPCGSVGFDRLAGLDSMVAGLASVVVGFV